MVSADRNPAQDHPAQAIVRAALDLHNAASANNKQQADTATRNLIDAYGEYNRATQIPGPEAAGPVDVDAVLNQALIDAQIAAVLAQAAETTGEVVPKGTRALGGPELAEAAPATELLDAANALNRTLAGPVLIREAEAAPAPSADLDTAKEKYRQAVAAFYDALETKTSEALTTAFGQITGLTPAQIEEALQKAGGTRGGPIIGQIWSTISNLVDRLRSLLGADVSGKIDDRVSKTLDDVRTKGLTSFLQTEYNSDGGKKTIDGLLDPQKDIAKIDAGTQAVVGLQEHMERVYAIIGGILTALQVAKSPLLLLGTAIFAGPFLIAMDVTLLLGMDYADTTQLVRIVTGIQETAKNTF